MAGTGNNTLSIRKSDLENQRVPQVGFRKLVFAHKAAAGETGIDLTAMTTPSEMSSAGFVQATSTEISAAKILFYRKNLKLVSSHKGELQDFLSYQVASNTRINFTDFTAEDGEIFVGVVDHEPTSGLHVVDAAPIIATGVLTAGTDEFLVGDPFEVNKYPTKQVGAVTVSLDGVQQFRNTGNATASPTADGNYQEIDGGSGLGEIIKFNEIDYAEDRAVLVVSTGLLVNRPTGSRDAVIESLATQIDQIIPVLADASGQPESYFQGQPNNVDLRAFGRRVFSLERWRLVTQAETAVGPVDKILANTSGGAYAITLPATPQVGDSVWIMDADSTFSTFTLTVARNGNLIDGSAADFTFSTDGAWTEFVFRGGSVGWIARV